MQSEPGLANVVILGIGINANQTDEELIHDNRNQSTSLATEKGQLINRAELLANILEEFEWLYETYLTHGFGEIKLLWEARSISIGLDIEAKAFMARFLDGLLGSLKRERSYLRIRRAPYIRCILLM